MRILKVLRTVGAWMFVIALCTVISPAQDAADNQATEGGSAAAAPTAKQGMEESKNEEKEQTKSPSTSDVSGFGKVLANGWNLAVAAQELSTYDSNPLVQPASPPSDVSNLFAAAISLTRTTALTRFEADYIPQYTLYRRFDPLNSLSHSYSQSLTHLLSPHTTLAWTMDAARYSMHNGGSGMAAGNFGNLLMALLGINSINLATDVTFLRSGMTITHQVSRRSSFSANLQGGTTRYASHDGGIISLFERASSTSRSGSAGIDYNYKLDAKRSVGIGVRESYTDYRPNSQHGNYQAINLRYQQVLGKDFTFQIGVGPGFKEQSGRSLARNRRGTTFDVNSTLQKDIGRTRVIFSIYRSQPSTTLSYDMVSWISEFSAQRSFGQHWVTSATAQYTYSSVSYYGTNSAELYSSFAQLGYLVRRNLKLVANYGFSTQHGWNGSTQHVNRQQVALGLVYDFDNFAFGH